jgi:uncharacterized membrane protein YkvI
LTGDTIKKLIDISYLQGTVGNSTPILTLLQEIHEEPEVKHTFSDVLLGDLLIIGAQILVAGQLVFEEKYIKKYDIPVLQVIGLEGLHGFTIMSVLLIPLFFVHVGEEFGQNPRHAFEDPVNKICSYVSITHFKMHASYFDKNFPYFTFIYTFHIYVAKRRLSFPF